MDVEDVLSILMGVVAHAAAFDGEDCGLGLVPQKNKRLSALVDVVEVVDRVPAE